MRPHVHALEVDFATQLYPQGFPHKARAMQKQKPPSRGANGGFWQVASGTYLPAFKRCSPVRPRTQGARGRRGDYSAASAIAWGFTQRRTGARAARVSSSRRRGA